MTAPAFLGSKPAPHSQPQIAKTMLIALLILCCPLLYVLGVTGDELAIRYFREQDRLVLLIACAGFTALPFLKWPWLGQLPFADRRAALATRYWIALLGTVSLVLWYGTYALMLNYPLTRDEHMVLFDMAVFDSGHLAHPLAAFWRPYAESLVPAFLLQTDNPIGLTSGYLPGNAAMRLAFSKLADPALLNPLLAALGGLALLDIARREFRDTPGVIALVMLFYLTSAQMLVGAMTCYAMTPHLAFNLIWLAAFLRGGRSGHMIAMAIGAYACGLHQIIFHPLFVGPFLLWRLHQGAWKIVLGYGVVYAAAGIGWVIYPMLAGMQASAPGIITEQADFLRGRVLPLLFNRDPNTLYLMAYNLLRFFAWQNLALLPLLVAAWPMVLRNRGIAAPLFAGAILTLLAVTFILPNQGHGWGYRYLHGYVGSGALLAGYGYLALCRRDGRNATEAGKIVTVLTAITVTVSLPWLMLQSHRFVAPYVDIDHLIGNQKTPLVLVDTQWPSNMVDQVRNLPDLSNRPIRLSSRTLTAELLAPLCKLGPIAIVSRADMHRAGLGLQITKDSPQFDRLLRTVTPRHPGCFQPAAIVD